MGRWFWRRLQGFTGDCLGATQQVCELAFYLGWPSAFDAGDACMKLWLVRHAQPLIAPGVCYGATDVAAEPQATLQAAHALAQALPNGVAVVSSTLQRCERLAHCLRGLRPDLAYKTDARLVEMDFGCWEGQRWTPSRKPTMTAGWPRLARIALAVGRACTSSCAGWPAPGTRRAMWGWMRSGSPMPV